MGVGEEIDHKEILFPSSQTNLLVEAKENSSSQIVYKKKKKERLHFFAILQREYLPISVPGGGPKRIIEK